jgi:hypothetical protein
MSNDKLLQQIVRKIQIILTHPSCYHNSPYAVEMFMLGLLSVAMSLESGDDLGKCMSRVWEEVKKLTENVPANREHHRCLCDEQILPERKASNQMLMKRGQDICARLLKTWTADEGVKRTRPMIENDGSLDVSP